MRKLRRRLITVPAVLLLWALALASAPVSLPLLLLIGLARRRSFILLRVSLFALLYLSLELVCLTFASLLWLRFGRDQGRFLEANLDLQRWWERVLFRAITSLLSLRFEVEGGEHAEPGGYLLFVRHASLIDTLLPGVLLAGPRGYLFRYVLKKELLLDPCFDVVGHRLPNHFVDRRRGGEEELAALRKLARDLGPREGIYLCPEGTVFTPEKRARILSRLERDGSPHLERARALEAVLPPRLGGALALLEAAPGADVVFLAHRGLEPFAYLRTILGGGLIGTTVRVRLWRIAAREIPAGEEARADWLFAQWARVDRYVRGLE